MLHQPSIKLAGLYLAVIMIISLFFSANVYQLSVQEFDRDFRRQGTVIEQLPGFDLGNVTRDQLMAVQQERFYEAKDRILGRLVIVNLVILVGGGILSYYLARRTIRPIEEAHEAQSRFTADASHELRTPLTAMQS